MIAIDKVSNVESNVGESHAYTIETNAKAFKVLISGIYSDKVRSIIREIWSNAFDSHVVYGNGHKPFEVTLPTILEPVFRVRDYGVGLSKKDVFGIYTVLFKSTKDADNIGVGKFGIGSKSPFAYTDTFMITSIYEGKKTYYSTTIDGKSEPRMHVMAEEDTDESNGLTVEFAVNLRDVKEFQDAAKKVGIGFEVKPKVTNIEHFKWEMIGEEIYPNIFYKPTNIVYNNDIVRRGTFAKMGCVLYPFDLELIAQKVSKFQVETHEEQHLVDSTLRFVRDMENAAKGGEVVFNFDIGDLEMSASREQLSYGEDEPTIGSFIDFVQDIVSHIEEECMALASEKYYIDACYKYGQISEKFNMFAETVRSAIVQHESGYQLQSFVNLKEFARANTHRFNEFLGSRSSYGVSRGNNTIGLRGGSIKAMAIKDVTKVGVLFLSSDIHDKTKNKTHHTSLHKRVARFVKAQKLENFYIIEVRDNSDVNFVHHVMNIFEGAKIIHAEDIPVLKEDLPEKDIKDKEEQKVTILVCEGGLQAKTHYLPLEDVIQKYGRDKIAVRRAEYPGQNLSTTLRRDLGTMGILLSEFVDLFDAVIYVNNSAKGFANKNKLKEIDSEDIAKFIGPDILTEKAKEQYVEYAVKTFSRDRARYEKYYRAIFNQSSLNFPKGIKSDLYTFSKVEDASRNSVIETLFVQIKLHDETDYSKVKIPNRFDEGNFLNKYPIFHALLETVEDISGSWNTNQHIRTISKHMMKFYGDNA